MKTKTILPIFILIFSLSSFAQQFEDTDYFNPADTIYLPHYGQNEILDSILLITMGKEQGFKGSGIGIINDGTPFMSL